MAELCPHDPTIPRGGGPPNCRKSCSSAVGVDCTPSSAQIAYLGPPDMSDSQDSPNLEDLTPEEANRIIHSHRKVRYGKSSSLFVIKIAPDLICLLPSIKQPPRPPITPPTLSRPQDGPRSSASLVIITWWLLIFGVTRGALPWQGVNK